MATAVMVHGVVRSHLHGPPEALAAVERALTFAVAGAAYTPAYKRGRWDGTISLLETRACPPTFPAGLGSRVRAVLQDLGLTVREQRTVLPRGQPYAEALHGVTLRPYQQALVHAALAAGRAVLQAPTGSGKTEIGAELVRRLGLPTLWVTHRRDLLFQTADRLSVRLGCPVGVVGAGQAETLPVTVGMVQTLVRQSDREWWRQWRVLVLDETHHGSSQTWYTVAGRCAQAGWRFGLSATPLTKDPLRDARLEGVTGPVIHEVTVAGETVPLTVTGLAAEGFLARPRIHFLRPPLQSYPTYEQVRAAVLPDWATAPRRLEKMGGRLYAEAYRRGVMDNPQRTELIAQTVRRHWAAGEKVLVLCTRLDHGEELSRAVQPVSPDGSGRTIYPVWWLEGSDSTEARREAVAAFRAHRGGAVLVASEIFREGVDIPEIDVLVLAGGGKVELATLQRVGRALRPRPDKPEVLVYDVWDGRSPTARKDYLAQHTQERLATYRAQGFEVDK